LLVIVALAAPTVAVADALDDLRFAAVARVEARAAACGVVGYDVGQVPVPPIANADRVYFRTVTFGGQTRTYWVGVLARGNFDATRYFAGTNGNLIGQFNYIGANFVQFMTSVRGEIAQLTSYFTVGPFGQEILDYQGYCNFVPYFGVLANGLYDAFAACVDDNFSAYVAAYFCNQ
jgi:hypothetical protein